jgi:hypothetical protein
MVNLSNSELQQRHANASITAMEALGHGKTYRNRLQAEEYKQELDKRGLEPLGWEAGIFNGPGAS